MKIPYSQFLKRIVFGSLYVGLISAIAFLAHVISTVRGDADHSTTVPTDLVVPSAHADDWGDGSYSGDGGDGGGGGDCGGV